jgi:MipA family protein
MTQALRPSALATLLFVCLTDLAGAGEKPLWELGAGVTALYFPDYPGSDQSSAYVLPFPYFVYRGDFFKADRDGIRGVFVDSHRIELNLSVGASLPVNSNQNRARQGMPDLQPTVEIGPALDIHLWRSDDRRYTLDLRLPVRIAVTVSGGMEDIGWVFSPRINLDIGDVAGLPGWNMGLLAGPMFGSERSHEHFYSVAPQYATADRPAFDAEGGYSGSQFLIAVSKRYLNYWIGGFARWDNLSGAAFAASPLVRQNYSFSAGIGVGWIFGESSTRVEAFE